MEVRPKWTEEELDIIFSKATLVLGELRKDASGVYIHRDASGKVTLFIPFSLVTGNTMLPSYHNLPYI